MASLSSILVGQLRRRGVAGSVTESMEDTQRALVTAGHGAWPEKQMLVSLRSALKNSAHPAKESNA